MVAEIGKVEKAAKQVDIGRDPAAFTTTKRGESSQNIAGAYIDNWSKLVIVTQQGKALELNYGGETRSGTVDGNTLTVSSFMTRGTVQDNGNISFADGGAWTKQAAFTEKGSHDLSGNYTDNWEKAVVVTQTGSALEVNYGGEMIKGVRTGTSAVHVMTFAAAGTVQGVSGDIVFDDGGIWKVSAEEKERRISVQKEHRENTRRDAEGSEAERLEGERREKERREAERKEAERRENERREAERRRGEEEKRRLDEEQARKRREEIGREEERRRRDEQEKREKEEAAANVVRTALQKLRNVTPENFDDLKADVKRSESENLDKLGPRASSLVQQDVEKELQKAQKKVEETIARREREEKEREEAERKRKGDEDVSVTKAEETATGATKEVEAAVAVASGAENSQEKAPLKAKGAATPGCGSCTIA